MEKSKAVVGKDQRSVKAGHALLLFFLYWKEDGRL